MSDGSIVVFDRRAVRQHRARAARFRTGEFLFRHLGDALAERLDEVDRRFSRAAILGARDGAILRSLAGRGIEQSLLIEPSAALLAAAPGWRVAGDLDLLPLAPASLDLVLALPSLHWADDLPGALLQLRKALRPDGLLLGALFGGETLHELRHALLEAELAEEAGASPRVSPFADARDLAGLLQRAGFALPVVDVDTLTLTYPDALALFRDLRAMGETNAVAERRRTFTRRGTLARAAALYAERFSLADGRIPATFQVVNLTAWAPHPQQPKPLRPGSARLRLADALGAAEHDVEGADLTPPR